MECVAHLHEASIFLSGIRSHRTCIKHTIISENTHRLPIQPRQSTNLTRAKVSTNFKKAFTVDHHFNNRAHIKAFVTLARHGCKEFLFHSINRIITCVTWRTLPNRTRQITQKLTNLPKCIVLIFCQVIDNAACSMNLSTAQFIFCHADAKRSLHQCRTANQYLSRVFGHNRKMRSHQATGRKSSNSTHSATRYRNLGHRVRNDLKTWLSEHRLTNGATFFTGSFYRTTTAFQHAYQRNFVLHSKMLCIDTLPQTSSIW